MQNGPGEAGPFCIGVYWPDASAYWLSFQSA